MVHWSRRFSAEANAVPVGLALGTVWILGGRPRELATAAIPPLLQSSDRYVAGVPRVLHAADVFWRPSNQLGVRNTDMAAQLEAGTLGARLWRLAPRQFSTLHRHLEQVELYVVLAGSGRIRVGGETHTLAPLSAVLVEPEVERQLFNDTAAEALWLVAGAPPEAANTLEMTPEVLARLYPQGPLAPPPELAPGTPELFIDVGSPYAYLAAERFEAVVGVRPVLQPVLLGAIFKARGRSSWGRTDARAEGMAASEARAAMAGLPPVIWPEGWPADYLAAMRAVVWAGRHGAGDAFARAAMRAAFTAGADLSTLAALCDVARTVGLDPDALEPGIANAAVKAELRASTDRALRLGVIGVPTTRVGDHLFWGDDRLPDVARAR
jgi:2-hydroxychromene-2-carboxylate isomerase/quercetin dioxygenase-like cupin family protein